MSVIYSVPGASAIEPRAPYRTPLIIPSPAPATVRVASDATAMGYVIINRDDFDAAVHTEYTEPAVEAKGVVDAPVEAPVSPAPATSNTTPKRK